MDQVMRLQQQIETQVAKYNQLHKKAQSLVQARNSLYQQQSQNSLVLKEINLLPQSSKIFKQVGGVLIDQKHKEATNTLSQRLNHINSQIDNTTGLIKKNQAQQKAMVQKIQKAKAYYTQMIQSLQQK